MPRLLLESIVIAGLSLLGAACILSVGAQRTNQQSAPRPVEAADVVERFRSRGLPIGDVVVYTAETDPNSLLGRPNQYTAKATFLDTRLTRENVDSLRADDGGTVETFATEADARSRQEYVGAIAKTGGPFAEYAYREQTVLVRLSRRLTPDQAAQYEAALKAP